MGEGIFSLSFMEILIIVFLAFLLLKPSEYISLGKWIGKMLRDIVTSDGWKIFQQTSREFRGLPNRLMRESNDEINRMSNEINASDLARIRFNSQNMPLRSPPPPPSSTTHSDSKDQDSSSGNIPQKDEGEKNA